MGRISQAVTNAPATVRAWGFGESKEKKTPFIWVEYVFDGFEDDDGSEVWVRDDMYLTEKTIEFVMKDLTTLGWNGTNIYDLHPENPNHYNLKGAKALLTVEMQDYQGNQYPKVKFVNDPNYIPIEQMPSTEVKKIGELFKGKITALRAKGIVAKPKPIQPEVKDENGIPF